MRIVYLAASWIPSHVASGVHVANMCQAFAARGHAVTLVNPLFKDRAELASRFFEFYGVDKTFDLRWLTPKTDWKPIRRAAGST